jgi:hypothetical protein
MNYELINKIYETNKKIGDLCLFDPLSDMSEIITFHEAEDGEVTSWSYDDHLEAIMNINEYKTYDEYSITFKPFINIEYIYFYNLLAKYFFNLTKIERKKLLSKITKLIN